MHVLTSRIGKRNRNASMLCVVRLLIKISTGCDRCAILRLDSLPGSVLIKTTLLKSLPRRSQQPDLALVKTSTDNSRWQTARCSDDRISRSLYTSGKAYGNLVLQATLPGAKKPPCMASTFLGKCASITAVDLIQRKKLGFLEVV